LHKIEQTAHFLPLILAISVLSGCQNSEKTGPEASSETAPTENPGASFLPDSAISKSGCDNGGALYTELYGSLAGEIEWYLDQMQCQGMPRPNGSGARLRFSGETGIDSAPIAFIIGIPGLERGSDGVELASNVTIIEERSSRFFSTPNLDSCWTDVEGQWAVSDDDDSDDELYRIDGVLYCISPLPEINGEGSVSLSELRFSGLLDWSAK
jgi:hypothetical protein